MRRTWVGAVLGAVCLTVSGLTPVVWAAGDTTEKTAPQGKQGATLPPDAPVAVVNGKPLTKADFDRALNAYLQRFRKTTGTMHGGVAEANDQMKSDVLRQLIDREILSQEASKHEVTDLAGKVDKELEGLKGRFPDEEKFKQALASEGLDEETLRTLIAQRITVGQYVEAEIRPGVSVSAEEVKKFYQDNEAKFSTPEQVKASHILIRTEAGADEAKKADARQKAEALRKRAEAGEDFATLSKENSEDPGSAARGGDLGFFTRDRMVKPFADAAFSLKKGEISQVVESRFGYHVILVTDRKEAGKRSLDEVKGDIRGYLEAQALNKAVQGKVAALKKDAKVEVVAPHL